MKNNYITIAVGLIAIVFAILWITKKSGDTIVYNNLSKVDSLRSEILLKDSKVFDLQEDKDSLESLILAQREIMYKDSIALKNKDAEIEHILDDIEANDAIEDSALFAEHYGSPRSMNDSIAVISRTQVKEINKNTVLLIKKNEYILIQSKRINHFKELDNFNKLLITNQNRTIEEQVAQLADYASIMDLKDEDLEKIVKNHKKELRRSKWKMFGIGALTGAAATLITITVLTL